MATLLNSTHLFPAAARAVKCAIANQSVVDVHPVAEQLAKEFPRHSRSELCAAVITAIALSGGELRWQAQVPSVR